MISVESIVKDCKDVSDVIVITGGEPLMWNMGPLTKELKKYNKKIHIETSGSDKVTGEWDWFCLSPKKAKLPISEAYDIADELKICLLYTSPSPRDRQKSRMPSSA